MLRFGQFAFCSSLAYNDIKVVGTYDESVCQNKPLGIRQDAEGLCIYRILCGDRPLQGIKTTEDYSVSDSSILRPFLEIK